MSMNVIVYIVSYPIKIKNLSSIHPTYLYLQVCQEQNDTCEFCFKCSYDDISPVTLHNLVVRLFTLLALTQLTLKKVSCLEQ